MLDFTAFWAGPAAVDHPIVQSYEPGEDWLWCYVDQAAFELGDVPSFTHP